MPVEILLRLHQSGTGLVPADSGEAGALLELRHGALYKAKLTQPRNPGFHRKFFALVRYLHSVFEPPEVGGYGTGVRADFDAFRDDLLIQAGWHDAVFRLDGAVRLKPKSISFAKMDNTTFGQLYSDCITAGLRLLPALAGRSADDVDLEVERVLAFI
jgi:hypothetical protein